MSNLPPALIWTASFPLFYALDRRKVQVAPFADLGTPQTNRGATLEWVDESLMGCGSGRFVGRLLANTQTEVFLIPIELDMSHRKALFHCPIFLAANPTLRLLALLCFASLVLGQALSAATFRVTTRIFEGSQLDASAEHLILFDEGLVYDFPQIESRYVTVFDPARNRVTLLDRQTQVQTTISVDNLIDITAQVRAAAKTPEQQEKLGLQAKVERSSRVNGYSVHFGNMEYHVTTQRPSDPSIASDFARFADLASRLNLVRRLGPPPFGRMTLNQHIASLSELPLETTLMLRRGEEAQEFRSTHVLEELESISPEDRKRIEEAQGMLAVYREVSPNEFP